MKLYKTSLATFGIGGAIIVAATLGVSYVRQNQNRDQLRHDLTQANSKLAKLPAPISTDNLVLQQKDLEATIAKAQSDYDAARTGLKRPLDSIEITDQLGRIASECAVELVAVDSPGPGGEELGGISFVSLPITAKAQGDVPNLVKFLSRVTTQFPVALVRSSEISVPPPDPTGKEIRVPSITFVLTAYSYEGK